MRLALLSAASAPVPVLSVPARRPDAEEATPALMGPVEVADVEQRYAVRRDRAAGQIHPKYFLACL